MTAKARKHPGGRRRSTEVAERERRLASLAGRQHGVVGRWQLAELGFGDEAINLRLASARLLQVRRGAHAVGHRVLSRRGKWMAAVLAAGPGSFLSHASAAALWGLAGDRPTVDVTAVGGRQFRPGRAGIRLHRCKFEPAEVTIRDGIPVSTVARTLLDLAERSEARPLRSAWEEASRLRLLRRREIEIVYERGFGRRARRRIKPLIDAGWQVVDDTRSPLEDRFAAFCVANHLPPPETNVLVDGDEVDALWPDARLIVELDSWEFHGHRGAFETDRARDTDHLLAGHRTIRVTHRRLDREPRRLAAQIRALLAEDPREARRPRGP